MIFCLPQTFQHVKSQIIYLHVLYGTKHKYVFLHRPAVKLNFLAFCFNATHLEDVLHIFVYLVDDFFQLLKPTVQPVYKW